VRGREQAINAGETLEIWSGTVHGFKNSGDEEARVLVELRPTPKTETAFETVFKLNRDGRLITKMGVPDPLQIAVLLDGYRDEVRAPWVPRVAQRALLGHSSIGQTMDTYSHC
jgi:hypothetical protein